VCFCLLFFYGPCCLKINDLIWLEKRSPKRLIVLVEPKSVGDNNKNFPALGAGCVPLHPLLSSFRRHWQSESHPSRLLDIGYRKTLCRSRVPITSREQDMSSIGLLPVYGNASNDDVIYTWRVFKMASENKKKCYDLKYKLNAVEFTEINSNEKAARKLTLR